MNSDRIEVSFEDEDERSKPTTQNSGRIIITNDDLANVPDTPLNSRPVAYGPQCTGYNPPQRASKSGITQVAYGPVVQSAVAGLIGGLLAWIATEPFFGERIIEANPVNVVLKIGVFGALIGGLIGCVLGAADDVLSQVFERAFRAGAIGFGIGAGGGFMGGMLGQIVFGWLLQPWEYNLAHIMIARVLGWSVLGLFVGVGQGVGRGSGRRVVNGVIGGTLGGLIAGFLFDPIAKVLNSGVLSRAVGITILGTAAGIAIGLVEEIRKEAWLSIISGPLAGKQFILYEIRTRIGSSPKCEITLLKDPAIMPEHALIEKQANTHVILALQAPILVNGQVVRQCRLQSGSILTIGSTSLRFEEKRAQY